RIALSTMPSYVCRRCGRSICRNTGLRNAARRRRLIRARTRPPLPIGRWDKEPRDDFGCAALRRRLWRRCRDLPPDGIIRTCLDRQTLGPGRRPRSACRRLLAGGGNDLRRYPAVAPPVTDGAAVQPAAPGGWSAAEEALVRSNVPRLRTS